MLKISSFLNSIAPTSAPIKFEAGPAKEIIGMPIRGSILSIIAGLTGTGLPQPNPAVKNKRVPIGS